MRRLFILMLMLLLPLQLSWAAMAPYCQNETAAGGATGVRAHIGHHEHRTAATSAATVDIEFKADAAQDQSAPDQAATDVECGMCHLSCCKSLFSALSLPQSAGFGLASYPSLPSRFSSHIANGPDKPDWQRSA